MRTQREWVRLTALLCTALMAPGDVSLLAQDQGTQGQAAEKAKVRTPDQLDSLVAPIALYPDPLLAQVLAASTYPVEIAQAARWLNSNKNLKGEALTKAAAEQPWDPSVQALVAFPDALKRLDEGLQWTTDLGNAFLEQPSDVMDAVQRMRRKAKDGGNLQSTKEQKVEVKTVENKSVIVIEPSNPQVVYVPSYNPTVVYGPPVYAYPPVSYPPYTPGAAVATAAISFGVGVAMGAMWSGCCGGGWGWGCGWGGNNNIYINNNFQTRYNYNNISGGNRYNNINGGNRVSNVGSGNRTSQWQHNPDHRRSTPYSSRAAAQRFGGSARDSSGQMQRFDRSAGELRGGAPAQTGSNRGAQPSTRDIGASRGSGGSSSLGANQDRVGNRSVGGGEQRNAFSGESRSRAQASSDRGFSSMRESSGSRSSSGRSSSSRSFGGGGGGRRGGGRRR